jgi:hypothetical protein
MLIFEYQFFKNFNLRLLEMNFFPGVRLPLLICPLVHSPFPIWRASKQIVNLLNLEILQILKIIHMFSIDILFPKWLFSSSFNHS